jgi:hypothetical protein
MAMPTWLVPRRGWIDESSPATNPGGDPILKVRSQGTERELPRLGALLAFAAPADQQECIVRLRLVPDRHLRVLARRQPVRALHPGHDKRRTLPPAAVVAKGRPSNSGRFEGPAGPPEESARVVGRADVRSEPERAGVRKQRNHVRRPLWLDEGISQ